MVTKQEERAERAEAMHKWFGYLIMAAFVGAISVEIIYRFGLWMGYF